MKKLFVLMLLLSSAITYGQIQIGAQASYLKGTGENTAALWGGGVHAKFFLGDHVALGGVVRIYPENTSESSYDNGGINYKVVNSDLLSNIMGSFDLLLGKTGGFVRPFIGVDAGISASTRNTIITSANTQVSNSENKQTFFIAAPKAGLNFELSKGFGFFGQAQYNLTFGSGDPSNITVPGFNNNSTTPVDKFFTFDAGVFFRFVGAGKK